MITPNSKFGHDQLHTQRFYTKEKIRLNVPLTHTYEFMIPRLWKYHTQFFSYCFKKVQKSYKKFSYWFNVTLICVSRI